jgi:uncharacterized protein YjbI with pentapeptide repeats
MSGANLQEADLSCADLSDASLSDANLSCANLSNADLSKAFLSGADLSDADLIKANLSEAFLSKAFLYNANLRGACLSSANLYHTSLSGANLSEADLSEANLYGADLSGANLQGANLSKADLGEAYLSGAFLRGAFLRGADLRNAILNYDEAEGESADLSDVNLSDANLEFVDMRGANLSNADLNGARLWNTNLRSADLSSANLYHTSLSGANLSGANLMRVSGLTIEQLSSVGTLYKAKLDPELKKQVKDKYPHLLGKIITLRSSYELLHELIDEEAWSMPNVSLYAADIDCETLSCHSIINHDYNHKIVSGDVVVVDNATGLMWHQNGSDDKMEWDKAKEWVKDLNSEEGYAGYQDWRLPTLEEAASLLESSKKNGNLYTDPAFSKKQDWIWTGDESEAYGSKWGLIVSFSDGTMVEGYLWEDDSYFYVRPVRSVLCNDSGEESQQEVYEEVEGLKKKKLRKTKNIALRSSYRTLSAFQVQHLMPNVSRRRKLYRGGFSGHSTINHDYNLKTVKGDKVVVDNATGLMWHQNGSDDKMEWDKAKEWVKDLNSEEGYAGYDNWRLPTLDEVASLLEPSKKNVGEDEDLYIDPVFGKNQWWIWTGDKCDYVFKNGSETAWYVDFSFGKVSRYYRDDPCFVRPVRSVR